MGKKAGKDNTNKSVKDDIELDIEALENAKITKPKKTKYERRKTIYKIVGWIMALAMIFGSLISIFGMLIYYK